MRHGWRGRAWRHEQLGASYEAAASIGRWSGYKHWALQLPIPGETEGESMHSKAAVLQRERGWEASASWLQQREHGFRGQGIGGCCGPWFCLQLQGPCTCAQVVSFPLFLSAVLLLLFQAASCLAAQVACQSALSTTGSNSWPAELASGSGWPVKQSMAHPCTDPACRCCSCGCFGLLLRRLEGPFLHSGVCTASLILLLQHCLV